MPRQSQSQTVAPDVVNSDGTVTRVITAIQTLIFQPDEYQHVIANQTKQLNALTSTLAQMQTAATQSAAIVTQLESAKQVSINQVGSGQISSPQA